MYNEEDRTQNTFYIFINRFVIVSFWSFALDLLWFITTWMKTPTKLRLLLLISCQKTSTIFK